MGDVSPSRRADGDPLRPSPTAQLGCMTLQHLLARWSFHCWNVKSSWNAYASCWRRRRCCWDLFIYIYLLFSVRPTTDYLSPISMADSCPTLGTRSEAYFVTIPPLRHLGTLDKAPREGVNSKGPTSSFFIRNVLFCCFCQYIVIPNN